MKKTTITILLQLFILSLFSQNTEIKYLSGTGNNNTVDWEFYCTDGQNSKKWATIPVPSNWELQGFGTYNYGHAVRNPEKSNLGTEKGLYKYKFKIPETWKSKTIFIVFEGSMTDTKVKINGKLAGPIHQGAFYRFQYDISRLVSTSKENLLEVEVSKMSSNNSINKAERQADYWIFGGIFRPVYLKAVPKQHINRIAINAKADGSFYADVFLSSIKTADKITAQIINKDNKPVGQPFSSEINRKTLQTSLQTSISEPLLWSAEFPNLYKVKIDLQKDGSTIHSITETFGFRTVEIRKHDGIYVNGVKVKLKGVNRHSHWPESGRTTSKELSIIDINLIKDMNMNAVRMSHYPPDTHFLEACDSLGLFVLDELAGWQQPSYDTDIAKKLIKEMIPKDVNHPSIILWDNANEGGWNYAVDGEFAKYDPQKRHVIHPWEDFDDIDAQHYKDYNYGAGKAFQGRDIYMPTEFLHGLYDGGHGAGLDDFWNLMLNTPTSAGGFLWVFADEGTVRTDKNGIIDTDGNHAPDGIVGPHREKEGSFYAIKEIWSPVFFEKKYIMPGFDGKFNVENRYHYTNLNQCTFNYQFVQYNINNKGETNTRLLDKGKIASPDVAPQHKGILQLNVPDIWKNADALYISAKDPSGRDIFTWSWPIKSAKDFSEAIVNGKGPEIEMKDSQDEITFFTNGTSVTINKKTGLLDGVTANSNKVSFSNGPKLIDSETEADSISYYTSDSTWVVDVFYKGKQKYKFSWIIYGNGWVQLDYEYNMKGELDFLGISFDYPEDKVTGMKWLGRGPYRVWKNRLKGMQFGLWNKEYNNATTGELCQYPEFKGYHSELYWAIIETKEKPFLVATATEDLYLRMFTPDQPKNGDPKFTKAAFPEGDISFLHAISPIGTKFKSPEKLGPQSQKNLYAGHSQFDNLKGTLYFYFGL